MSNPVNKALIVVTIVVGIIAIVGVTVSVTLYLNNEGNTTNSNISTTKENIKKTIDEENYEDIEKISEPIIKSDPFEYTHTPPNDRALRMVLENIRSYLVPTVNYNQIAFGGFKNVFVTLHNKTSYNIDYAAVSLEYIKSNGDIHKKDIIFFNDIPAGQKIIQKGKSSNRGTSIKATLLELKSYDLKVNGMPCYNCPQKNTYLSKPSNYQLK